MPKTIRELKKMLLKAGFTYRTAKGSHTVWEHPLLSDKITLSGNDGNDAKKYLEQRIIKDIKKVEELSNES